MPQFAPIALIAILFGLNAWACRVVARDDLSSRAQHIAQVALIWFVPFLGALVVMHLLRKKPEKGMGRYPNDPEYVDDYGVSGQSHRDFMRAVHSAGEVSHDSGADHG